MYSREQLKKYSEFFEWDFLQKPEACKIKKNPLRDLMIADVHTPFHLRKLLDQIIEENLDSENLWIAGDWWDMYSKSRYRKEIDIDFSIEYREGYAMLFQLAGKFKKIYLQTANHDSRFRKWIFDNVPTEMLPFTDYNMPENLLRQIPNLNIVKQRAGRRSIDYIYQHKNMIITHLEKSNRDISKTVQEIEKDFARWGEFFELKNYNMVVQAHNHQSARIRYGNKFLFQIPCLIDISQPAFNYVFNGKLVGNPPAIGYISLAKKKDGSFDPTKTQIIDYDYKHYI